MQKLKIVNKFDERSAGGVVYRIEKDRVYWLLIKTPARKRFVRSGSGNSDKNGGVIFKFPKGHLLKNEFLKKAATREVEEEGQVKAEVVGKIGSRNYVITDKLARRKIVKRVTFFLMKYLEDSRLRHFDQEAVIGRGWFTFEEALEKLAYESERMLLKKARDKLGKI